MLLLIDNNLPYRLGMVWAYYSFFNVFARRSKGLLGGTKIRIILNISLILHYVFFVWKITGECLDANEYLKMIWSWIFDLSLADFYDRLTLDNGHISCILYLITEKNLFGESLRKKKLLWIERLWLFDDS